MESTHRHQSDAKVLLSITAAMEFVELIFFNIASKCYSS